IRKMDFLTWAAKLVLPQPGPAWMTTRLGSFWKLLVTLSIWNSVPLSGLVGLVVWVVDSLMGSFLGVEALTVEVRSVASVAWIHGGVASGAAGVGATYAALAVMLGLLRVRGLPVHWVPPASWA